MKKLVILISLGLFAAFNAISQCTPDEGCLDIEDPGQICPMAFDTAYVNVPYEQVITFIPSATYNYNGMDLTVQKIVINSVSGLPAGLDWDTNAEEFIPTNPITRYCGVIFGTPTTEGEYPFEFAATVTVLLGSFPVAVPVTQETLGYEAKVVIRPENQAPPVADFTSSSTTANGGEPIQFTDMSFNATAWAWTFEGAMNPTSTEQNPTTTWYAQGTYDVTLTVTNTNCFPPKTHTLIAEDYITITSNVNPYYFQESAQICEGDLFTWQGETYNTQGTHFAYYTSIHGMDSIYELTLTVNPVYFFTETHVLCDGDLYSWHGTDYSTVGVYTATYLTSAGCDSIYELTLTVNPSYEFVTNQNICDGEFFEWRGNNYDVPGTYTDLYYTNNGCDSVFVLNLTVNSLPQQVVVLQNPSDGILTSGNYGQISLSTSFVGTEYWVTMGGAYFTGEIGGTGSGLSLGNSFPPGSYNIWSRNQYGCVLLQGTVSFVENTGANKIVTNVTFGTPASNFPANHVKVVLYRKTTDIGNNEVVVFEDEQLLGTNGQAEFNNLQPGDYYLGSFIQYPDNYNVASHIYYQTSIVHEDAISIPVVAGTVFIAGLHHVTLAESIGTNSGGGIVGTQDDKKSLNPLKDMVVILRDMDAEEIIGVSVTNVDGQYAFQSIPENTNIQIFVTSFEHQNWIPYQTLTGNSQYYNVNFIVDGNSVYPDGSTGIADFEMGNIDFSIYPNPAKNLIQVFSNIDRGVLSIYDINGKLIQTELVFSNCEINISKLSSGNYVIVLTNEHGDVGVNKFVKE